MEYEPSMFGFGTNWKQGFSKIQSSFGGFGGFGGLGGFTKGFSNNEKYIQTTRSSIVSILGYFVAIIVIIMSILLLINYTLYPVFQLSPGGSGIIPIPGLSDGQLFWKNGYKVSDIKSSKTKIANVYENWSMTLDVFITNALIVSTHPRIIFNRGGAILSSPVSNTISGLILNYNIAMALTPDTNDLLVSVCNSNNNAENVLISNIPIQTPFRIGVIIMDSLMEIYVNGRLSKTHTFSSPPISSNSTDIFPPQNETANYVKVGNLQVWPRVLTPSEMKYAQPSLISASVFEKANKNSSSGSGGDMQSCPGITSQIETDVSSIKSSMKS